MVVIKMTETVPATIEARQLEIKGHRIHYLKAGSGPPVVLLHGGASDSRDWLPTMGPLGHRFTFYAPDLIGFGQSERKRDGYYLTDFIEFTEEFINTLGLENPDMVGHSFGGRISAGVAVRDRVKIRRLVLVDASGLGKFSSLGNVIFTGFTVFRKLAGRPQPYPHFLAKDGEDYNWIGDEALRGLRMPTLLVWKRFDPYLPVSSAVKAAQFIPAARLEIIPGVGHAPNKQNTTAFNRLLLDFLGRDETTFTG
jgi:pimeloyl-ACP methyl ester carboxylesterase